MSSARQLALLYAQMKFKQVHAAGWPGFIGGPVATAGGSAHSTGPYTGNSRMNPARCNLNLKLQSR